MNKIADLTSAPSMPEAEVDVLRSYYEAASVILEYGSGGSTRLAASSPGKFVMSVESDRDWAMQLQQELDASELLSPAVVYHVDIGPTGSWGRPRHAWAWPRFHRYPLAIWDEPFFRHPDVVLVDGRFRPACLIATALRITRPVTVLFDDYVTRPVYHPVEKLLRPTREVGRMVLFELVPGQVPTDAMTQVFDLFARASYAKD